MTFLITAPYKYSYLLTSLLVYNNLKILKFTRVITLQLIDIFLQTDLVIQAKINRKKS